MMRARSLRPSLLALLGLAALFLSSCEGFDRGELHRKVGTVQAVSAEGALLAHEVALDRSKDSFVSVHAEDLAGVADEVTAKLQETVEEGGVPAELRKPVQRTIVLSGDASDDLEALAVNRRNPPRAARLEERLRRVSDLAGRLLDEL